MSRTRGASERALHMDDGELLDKEGKPMPTGWTMPDVQTSVSPEAVDAVLAVSPPPTVVTQAVYRSDKTTWLRDMDAYEAIRLLDLMFEGLSVDVAADAFSPLPADVKRHFRRV